MSFCIAALNTAINLSLKNSFAVAFIAAARAEELRVFVKH
jgi:hypothetical protein